MTTKVMVRNDGKERNVTVTASNNSGSPTTLSPGGENSWTLSGDVTLSIMESPAEEAREARRA